MSTELLTLRLETPLALHRRRASEQFAASLDYLPGSSIRGAIADAYLSGDAKAAQNPTFRELFLSHDVRFSDFFVVRSTTRGLSRLLPLTAMACKRFRDHEPSSLTDSLLRLELAREMEQPSPIEHRGWKNCPECMSVSREEKRDRIESGYYSSLEGFKRLAVRKRMIAGTAIERAIGTAAHGMLFSHEVIEESTSNEEMLFRGTVTLPDNLRPKLRNLLPLNSRLSVGYGRTRGLGQLSVASWGDCPVERQTLSERLLAFNLAAANLWRLFSREPPGKYFSLTLQGHVVLRNPAFEPLVDTVTARDFGLPPEAKRCRSVLNPVLVPGWNAALNLPKSDSWALGRGSVLLFCVPTETDASSLIEALTKIEQQAVGERRAEGFGRVMACDPFHYYLLDRELKGAIT